MADDMDIKDNDGRKTKGRGFKDNNTKSDLEERYVGKGAAFDNDDKQTGPVKSVEGWIVFVSGVHEEASEDDVLDKFSDFGEVKNLQMPLDRRTGFVKGYAMLEYTSKEQAEAAIRSLNGSDFMEKKISVDWAFYKSNKGNKSSRR